MIAKTVEVWVFDTGACEVKRTTAIELRDSPEDKRPMYLYDRTTYQDGIRYGGIILYTSKEKAIDRLTEWCGWQREKLTNAYRWMADHAGKKP